MFVEEPKHIYSFYLSIANSLFNEMFECNQIYLDG